MKTLGNFLWLILGGLPAAACWFMAGCLWCISIIGIPVGLQCFKFAGFTLWPFGKEIVYGAGGFSFIINVVWIALSGFELCIIHLVIGAILCATIVGAPFGLQSFKLAKLALMPFGARVV